MEPEASGVKCPVCEQELLQQEQCECLEECLLCFLDESKVCNLSWIALISSSTSLELLLAELLVLRCESCDRDLRLLGGDWRLVGLLLDTDFLGSVL